jgi:hypothetical protein
METSKETDLIEALGMASLDTSDSQAELEGYEVVPNPDSEAVDLSELRGANKSGDKNPDHDSDTELEGLAELVPDIKARRRRTNESGASMNTDSHATLTIRDDVELAVAQKISNAAGEEEEELDKVGEIIHSGKAKAQNVQFSTAESARRPSMQSVTELMNADSMRVQKSKEEKEKLEQDVYEGEDEAELDEQIEADDESFDTFPGSDGALNDLHVDSGTGKVPKEFINMSSGQSVSTATQTQEVRMPMYLPTFKPATGCTNASDFIVRCFVARLRSGITVVKHGRSRWCKSRLRVLHIHPDGRSLSWKPAEGEPVFKRLPLDLSTCLKSDTLESRSAEPNVHGYIDSPAKMRGRQCAQIICAHFQTANSRHYGGNCRSVQSFDGRLLRLVLSTTSCQSGQGRYQKGCRSTHARGRRRFGHCECDTDEHIDTASSLSKVMPCHSFSS